MSSGQGGDKRGGPGGDKSGGKSGGDGKMGGAAGAQ